jgi:hypothetical protein
LAAAHRFRASAASRSTCPQVSTNFQSVRLIY